jgi:phosphohistidine phosphatase SixA
MSTLFLVRHGQASFFGADYDRLSELGTTHSRLLGEHWARRGFEPDAVWVGPRRRHRQTYEAVRTAFAAQERPLPDPVALGELDEYTAVELLKWVIPDLVALDSEAAAWPAEYQAGTGMAKGSF